MRTEKSMVLAFVLNLSFSIFEVIGGIFTGSVAIVSDAIHDLGDALSIGVACFLEKKSKQSANDVFTYGYGRYSVAGSLITVLVLLVGSVTVIASSVQRLFAPSPIHYNGMICFAVVGIVVNFLAAFLTRKGESYNQKAINLHMLEDTLGWVVVLVGAIIMRFTDLLIIDPLMSITVAVYILVCALRQLKESLAPFLEKVPVALPLAEIRERLLALDGVSDVHHFHFWSLDGHHHCATLHLVADHDPTATKQRVRAALHELGVVHVTIELEEDGEDCVEPECGSEPVDYHHHHH